MSPAGTLPTTDSVDAGATRSPPMHSLPPDHSDARTSLSERAAAHIRASVISGALRPGEVVRPEVVGEALGISTTPAREALQALRVEGFIDTPGRRGFVVASITGDDIRDLFCAQALLAGELAARAAAAAGPADLAELTALHHELLAAAARSNTESLERKNHEFHRCINRLAHAPRIARVLGLLTRYVPRQFYASIPGWPEATAHDHQALLEGIRQGDPEVTRAAMQAHITHAGELLAEHFDARIARVQEPPGRSG
jgi:DNA-binding GntR family transcriptional regulator